MSEAKKELEFEAIKIGLASPEQIREWLLRRGQKAGDHKLPFLKAGARRSFLRKDLRNRPRTGNVIAESIRESAIRARYATAAVLK